MSGVDCLKDFHSRLFGGGCRLVTEDDGRELYSAIVSVEVELEDLRRESTSLERETCRAILNRHMCPFQS